MFKHQWVWDKIKPSGMQTAKYKPMPVTEDVLVFASDSVNYYPSMTGRKDKKLSRAYSFSASQPVVNISNRLREYTQKYPQSIIRISNADQTNKLHPTQKPLKLFEYLIKTYTQENEIVLDMTCGSGTTAHAAMNLGRQFICGDITEEYVEIARKRLQNANPYVATVNADGSKQLSLFEKLS
jgi:site-specific DNA-methyltransferase (adenine-specific)